MYQVNMLEDGYTVYEFTPGWFDDIAVNRLVIRWNAENACSWSPSCNIEDGYLTWSSNLNAGARYNVSITYPNSAYDFDFSKTIEDGGDNSLAVISQMPFALSSAKNLISMKSKK